jgi:nucleotide-binding universal stress UspA family protein
VLKDKFKASAELDAKPPRSAGAALPGTILVHIPTEGDAESCRLALALAEPSRGAVCAVISEGFEPAAFRDMEFTPGSVMQALFDARARRIASARARAEELKPTADVPITLYVEEAFPEDAVAMHACGADWIVLVRSDHRGAHAVHADPSSVVLRTGAPVLIAPREAPPLAARSVVIAWRDSPEARRAISAALPILQCAKDVLVVAVCPADRADEAMRSLGQVVARLERRGCKARCELHQTEGHQDVVSVLEERASAIGADLIVAGAYAHSRTGEWVFGGVTRSLLDHCSRHLLMIH